MRFIESGQILEDYPDSQGRRVAIQVVGKHALSNTAETFFRMAQPALEETGVALRFEQLRI